MFGQSISSVCLILYQTMQSINTPGTDAGLLKTLWEKEKMLVTRIFPFSHNVFYSVNDKLYKTEPPLSSANDFSLDRDNRYDHDLDQGKMSSFGRNLKLLKLKNF